MLCDLQQQINEALKTWENFFYFRFVARSRRAKSTEWNRDMDKITKNKVSREKLYTQARSFFLLLLREESINSI
jgi:hypothetical protein